MVQPNPALESFLRSIPLFSLAEGSEMLDLLRLLEPVTLEEGAVLFQQGEPGRAMWALAEGAEVAVRARLDGGEVELARLGPGEVVGEMALVDDGPRSATAVVTRGGAAHRIPAMDFQVLREGMNPAAYKVLRRLCAELSAKLRAVTERLGPVAQGGRSAPPREEREATGEDVGAFQPLSKLPSVVKLALAQKLSRGELPVGERLFAEGDGGEAAYFVIEGSVTATRRGRALGQVGPGGMIGLVAVIDGGARSASCVAERDSVLLRLSAGAFDALFAAGNRFAFQVVDRVARQLVSHLRETNRVAGPEGVDAGEGVGGGPRVVSTLDLGLELELDF